MIDSELAKQSAALISTAIGELMEDASADAIRVDKGDLKLTAIKADSLQSIGADVACLAEAMAILVRRSDYPS